MNKTIFIINLGSTSTKIALFENTKEVFSEILRHQTKGLEKFSNI